MMNTDETKAPEYYNIVNLPKLTEKFAKLQKRAKKLSVACPSFKVIGSHLEYERVYCDEYGTPVYTWIADKSKLHPATQYTGRVQTVSHVVLEGAEVVKLNGWTFVATLDHELGADNTIVRMASSEAGMLPAEFRKSGAVCSHCKGNRYRKNTYVVRHENGELKQVGSTCIHDFLGTDARAIIFSVDLRVLARGFMDEDGEGVRGTNELDLETYLAWVAREIRLNGWASRSNSDFGKSTADRAFMAIRDFYKNRVS